MGTVILIRHARSVANAENILAGQTPGVRLDPTGVAQSKELIETLGPLPLKRVFVSPLERCSETIAPWLAQYGDSVSVQSDSRIIEPDYGLWSGRKLEELSLEPLWKQVQSDPESVQFPSGERFVDVWDRVASFYQSLIDLAHEDDNFLVVSHGDIIKFLIAQMLKVDFRNFQSLVVEPASISVAQISPDGPRLLQFNRTQQPLAESLSRMVAKTLGGEGSNPSGGAKH